MRLIRPSAAPFAAAALAAVSLCLSAAQGGAAQDGGAVSGTGLPVPRFVSLKSDHVNVRGGPTKDNDVSWIYTRSSLPVEITAEFENWRRIRDSEGSEGWVYQSLLSGKRTAVVTMKRKDELAPIYASPDAASGVAARLQAGAALVQLYTGLIYGGPRLVRECVQACGQAG